MPQPGSQQPAPASHAGSQQPLVQLVPHRLAFFSEASRSRIGVHFFRTPQQPTSAPQAGSQQPAPASQAGSEQPAPASHAGSQQLEPVQPE